MHWRLLDYQGQLMLKLDEHCLTATTRTTFTGKRDIRDLTQFSQHVTTTSIAGGRELQTSLLTRGGEEGEGEGGCYSGFQVTGMIDGLFGV